MRHFRDNKFIISCPARSGSTMLVHLLRSNPHILCHGEVFGGDTIGPLRGVYPAKRKSDPSFEERLWQYRTQCPETFLYDIVFDTQDRRVVGFKFKTDEAFDPKYQDVFDIIRRDTAIKVIHLRRKDLLDQYISHQVVLNQTQTTFVTSHETIPEISPFRVDIPHLLAYFSEVLKREKLAHQVYANHRQAMVNYEDLVHETHPIRDSVQMFLGLQPVPLTTTTRKIIQRNTDLIMNREEVIAVLTQHGYTHRCLVEEHLP